MTPVRLPLALGLMALGIPAAAAQTPPRPAVGRAVAPAWKGVLEPVNHAVSLDFTDVFFTTIDVGWVSGSKGTILHTTDGGTTWTAQLGGDPESADEPVTQLRFFDERHGWALQGWNLLRTTDGESWAPVGQLTRAVDYVFLSAERGVAAVEYGASLAYTVDAGRTWKAGAPCSVAAVFAGTTHQLDCTIRRIHFPSASVGYLVGYARDPQAQRVPVIGKTVDGGESWTFFAPPERAQYQFDLFFSDERNGVLALDERLLLTSDGGESWRAVIGTARTWTRFADPEVGWSLGGALSYTTDGGAHWSSRPLQLPRAARALSLPRRDRAYVVGDGGMILRYRVVPAAEPGRPGTLATVAMPVFASPLGGQVSELGVVVQDLSTAVARLPDPASGADSAGVRAATDSSLTQDVATPSGFVEACCGKPAIRLGVLLGAVLETLPQFVTRFKNANLLSAGLHMLATLPGQLGELRRAARAFLRAADKSAALAALAELGGAAAAIHQATRQAFQEVGPAPGSETENETHGGLSALHLP